MLYFVNWVTRYCHAIFVIIIIIKTNTQYYQLCSFLRCYERLKCLEKRAFLITSPILLQRRCKGLLSKFSCRFEIWDQNLQIATASVCNLILFKVAPKQFFLFFFSSNFSVQIICHMLALTYRKILADVIVFLFSH